MKNLTINQLAKKCANKTNATKNKYHLFVMENFSKNDYIVLNQKMSDIEMHSRPSYVGSDSLVR